MRDRRYKLREDRFRRDAQRRGYHAVKDARREGDQWRLLVDSDDVAQSGGTRWMKLQDAEDWLDDK